MEDAIFPLKLSRFPEDLPLLPSIEYDFQGLQEFPTRHGYSSSLRDLDERTAEDAASLVQSWLFFGLLADLTGRLVDRQSVLHPSSHQHRTDTVAHPATLQHPELSLRVTSSLIGKKSKTLSRKIRRVVRIGIDSIEKIDRLTVAGRHPMPLVLLSVKILLSDLAVMRIGHSGIYSLPWGFGLDESRLVPCPPSSSFLSSSAKTLNDLMISKGWCPHQIHRISSTYDYSMIHHLSTIDRRISEKTAHGLCSSNHCQAYNSEPDSYVTSHTVPGCQCSFIAAPTEQLSAIIRSGGVPLVSLHEASHGKLTIRMHTSKAKSRYTAISHVWSGGLGNVQANSLPLCQLRYLNHCLSTLPKDGERGFNYQKNAFYRDLSGKVWISPLGQDNLALPRNRVSKLFWMDTLCIPVDPKSSDLRMEAITKMDAVYAHAMEVLVLDSEIQRLSIGGTHPCEIMTRLAYSSWMGRSWTLQEGAIGRAAYFQCADGALTLERPRSYFLQQNLLSFVLLGFRGVRSVIRRRATKINCSKIAIEQNEGHGRVERSLLNALQTSLHRGRDASMNADKDLLGLVPEDMQLDSFVSVWNELIERSTTQPQDMFAIFANLLDFNAGQIIKLPHDERMQAILWSSSMIPFSLLYNTGPRLNDGKSHRDGWVPTMPKGSRLTNSPSMKFAEDGRSFLLASTSKDEKPSALIVIVDQLPLYFYLLDTGNDRTYFVKVIRSLSDTGNALMQQKICIVMEQFPPPERKCIGQAALKTRGACLFVTSIRSSYVTTTESSTHLPGQPSQTPRRDKTTLSTIYDCPVRIWEVNDTKSIPDSELRSFDIQDRPDGCPIIQGEPLKKDYELYLETDCPRPEKPYARRTLPTNPSLIGLNVTIVMFLLFLFSQMVPLIFFALAFAQEKGNFTTLGKVAIVCYSFSFLWMLPIFSFLVPISAILVMVDRIHRSEFNAVTIAYIAFTFGGLLPGTLYAILWDVALRDYAYKAWLATFEEDWDTNGKYKAWWWIFAVNVRLVSKFKTMEKWYRRQTQKGPKTD